MRMRFLKLKDWLLMSAMSALGLTSCHPAKELTSAPNTQTDTLVVEPDPRDRAVVMYGVPTMDFVVKGRVIDPQGQPVSGMQVILVDQSVDITPESMQDDNPYVQEYIREASDTTAQDGQFQCHVKGFPVEQQRVIVRDIDGDANGQYKAQMVDIDFLPTDQTRTGHGWYQGERTKDVDITVEIKN